MDPFEMVAPFQDLPTFAKVIEVAVAVVAMVAAVVVLYFHLSNRIYKYQAFKNIHVFSYII